MTKGRNQDRSQREAEPVEREQEAGSGGTAEGRRRSSSGRAASPADVARKHQRRFGHN